MWQCTVYRLRARHRTDARSMRRKKIHATTTPWNQKKKKEQQQKVLHTKVTIRWGARGQNYLFHYWISLLTFHWPEFCHWYWHYSMWLLLMHCIRMCWLSLLLPMLTSLWMMMFVASVQCISILCPGRNCWNCSLLRSRRVTLVLASTKQPIDFEDLPNHLILSLIHYVFHCSTMPTMNFELPTIHHHPAVFLHYRRIFNKH